MRQALYHTVSTAARALGLSPSRVRQLCNEGRIPCVLDATGRRLITEDALMQYLKESQQPRKPLLVVAPRHPEGENGTPPSGTPYE
jgi:excisionase family DNA binding protein